LDNDYGHWYPLTDRPDNAFGFIYYIGNLETGRRYIGRKQLISVSRKLKSGSTRRTVTRKESDWRSYQSSCRELLNDIEKYGPEAFTFVIYKWCFGAGDLTYSEVHEQWQCEVLSRHELPNGERVWYNGNIGAVKFLKPKQYEEE
jgi:hypothetical protein